ncbi:hypothetical protein [Archaeoglobus sp.]
MKRVVLMLLMVLIILKPCLADPIPAPPPPRHVMFIQLIFPILINYLWNFLILGTIFSLLFGIEVRSKKFPLFVLTLTFAGLIIDMITFILKIGFNFLGWILVAGASLFAISFILTRLFYQLPKKKCAISGLTYALASHPVVGITYIVPVLAKFSLMPPL